MQLLHQKVHNDGLPKIAYIATQFANWGTEFSVRDDLLFVWRKQLTLFLPPSKFINKFSFMVLLLLLISRSSHCLTWRLVSTFLFYLHFADDRSCISWVPPFKKIEIDFNIYRNRSIKSYENRMNFEWVLVN